MRGPVVSAVGVDPVAVAVPETYPVGLSASPDEQQVAVLGMSRLDVVNLASGAIWSDDTLEQYFLAPSTLPVPTWSPDALLVPAWSNPQETAVVRAYAPAGCGAPTCGPLWVSEPVSGDFLHQPASTAGGVVVTLTEDTLAVYPTACTDPCAALVTHTTSSSFRSLVAPTIAAGRILFADDTSVVAWRPASA